MGFISPMLASAMNKKFPEIRSGEWVAEEKYDGHRLVVEVKDAQVAAWSRYGLSRILPKHIVGALSQFPNGVYDGELIVPGKRSYGVVESVNTNDLIYTMFDILQLLGQTTMDLRWFERQEFLREIFHKLQSPAVVKAWNRPVNSSLDVQSLVTQVWKRDGEGLILKKIDKIYSSGERPKGVWVKIKALRSMLMTVVGFKHGRNGPCSAVRLVDDKGGRTTVKTRNYEELDKLSANPESFLGKKLWIEYQERTPDGSYRHPRWDRWDE